MQSNQFVKLTQASTGNRQLYPVDNIHHVSEYIDDEDSDESFCQVWWKEPGNHGDCDSVSESLDEVLALLAGRAEGSEIGDVVEKLRFVRDDAALRKAAAAATEITLVMRFDQLDRLVAYFDGRKTDA